MKKKDKTALQTMKPAELEKTIVETRIKLAQWKVNRYSKQSKNVRESRELRRKIAVAQTALRNAKKA